MSRAVGLGLPMFLGILGGTPEHWAQYGRAYRAAWDQTGHPAERADIAVAVHGFVAESDARARSVYLEHEHRMKAEGLAELGRPAPSPADRAVTYGPDGMVFVGSPDEITDRILHLHRTARPHLPDPPGGRRGHAPTRLPLRHRTPWHESAPADPRRAGATVAWSYPCDGGHLPSPAASRSDI
jgi:alkanesulfonate monooxygenase SsuD/methylene tetrahydromethanopterin reductase-like flavin-dependent oxidoreductase (luciferase family)